MTLSSANLLAFASPLWLLAGALVILVLTLVRPSRGGREPAIVGLVALLGSLGALVSQVRTPLNILNGAFVLDGYAVLLDLVLLATAGAVLLSLTSAEPHATGDGRAPAFVLLATGGGMLLVSAGDLLSFFAAQELLAVSAAIAIGLRSTRREAAVGPLLIGLAGSAAVAYGLAVAYGATGETALAGIGRVLAARGAHDLPALAIMVLVLGGASLRLIVAGFGWLADDRSAGAWDARAVMAALLTVAGFGGLQRMTALVFVPSAIPWQAALAGLAVVVMTGGTIGALGERRLHRALAFAAAGQAGFILAGLAAVRQPSGVAGVTVLLVGSAPALLAAIIPAGWFADRAGARDLADVAGMARRAPLPGLVLALGATSLAGLPPLIGFFGRLLVLIGAVESGLTWLALVGLVNMLLMVGWAVRALRLVALEAPGTEQPEPALEWPARIAFAAASAGVAGLALLLSPITNAAATVSGHLPK
jgi:NADH-quinone oxidoreductase subunit N